MLAALRRQRHSLCLLKLIVISKLDVHEVNQEEEGGSAEAHEVERWRKRTTFVLNIVKGSPSITVPNYV
jgi:hypothetical protein